MTDLLWHSWDSGTFSCMFHVSSTLYFHVLLCKVQQMWCWYSASVCVCDWCRHRQEPNGVLASVITFMAELQTVCVCVCVCVEYVNMCVCLYADVDECSTVSGICDNGHCINMAGSFRCDCHSGYRPSTDHKHCIGIMHTNPLHHSASWIHAADPSAVYCKTKSWHKITMHFKKMMWNNSSLVGNYSEWKYNDGKTED